VLRLPVSPEERPLVGVHVFGTGATELVHIGHAVMGCGATMEYLVDLQQPFDVIPGQGR
jgi:NAD(P) transhydrogenase